MTNLSADEVNGVQKYLEMANPHSDLGPTPLEAMLILDRFVSSADLVTFIQPTCIFRQFIYDKEFIFIFIVVHEDDKGESPPDGHDHLQQRIG